jgi:hypothetical protein
VGWDALWTRTYRVCRRGSSVFPPFPSHVSIAAQHAPKMIIPMHPVRVILWTVVMAYSGFLLTGQGLRTFNSLSITEAFLGALTGFLLATMFTLRERRRQRPAVVTYPMEQIFPNWGKSRENGGSHPKPKG